MRLIVATCLVLALACAAMLFPGDAAEFLLWMEDWWNEQS
jgi:hypothetical protein